jgi:hypothetical protein
VEFIAASESHTTSNGIFTQRWRGICDPTNNHLLLTLLHLLDGLCSPKRCLPTWYPKDVFYLSVHVKNWRTVLTVSTSWQEIGFAVRTGAPNAITKENGPKVLLVLVDCNALTEQKDPKDPPSLFSRSSHKTP